MTYSCPSCGKQYTPQLTDSWILLCTNCRAVVTGEKSIRLHGTSMPDDWSVLQIGSNGIYKNKPFKITGRARIQLENDFKNLWCASYDNGSIWIAQNLESTSFLLPPFTAFTGDYSSIRAGNFVEFSSTVKMKCEFVEACTDLQIEGEISNFPITSSGFHLAQVRNKSRNSALIVKKGAEDSQFLWGEIAPDDFKFDNLKKLDEWK
jgi:hypothetical protein